MNQKGPSHMQFHINFMNAAESYYEQYVISCCLKGKVPLSMKQLRKLEKKNKKK